MLPFRRQNWRFRAPILAYTRILLHYCILLYDLPCQNAKSVGQPSAEKSPDFPANNRHFAKILQMGRASLIACRIGAIIKHTGVMQSHGEQTAWIS